MSEDFPSGKHAGEGRVITCEYDGFYLVNVYVPNSKGDLSRLGYRYESWDPDLKDYLIELRAKKPVILCGDLNVAHREIDLANPKTNRKSAGFTDQEREGISNLFAEGFLDTFRHLYPDLENAYSWWSYRAGARARNVGGGSIISLFPMILPPRFGMPPFLLKLRDPIIVRLVYPSPTARFFHEYFPRIPF